MKQAEVGSVMSDKFGSDEAKITLAGMQGGPNLEIFAPWESFRQAVPGNANGGYRGNFPQSGQIEIPTPYTPGQSRDSQITVPVQYDQAEVRKALQDGLSLYDRNQPEKAFRYLEYAAKGGSTEAQLRLGYMYEKGIGVDADYEEAAAYYYDAARQGEPQAMKNLGQMYEYGLGVEEDWSKAAEWYQRGARRGNVQAQSALARAYQFGIGVPQNRDQAIYWNNQAAMNGDPDAAQWARKLSSRTNFIGFRSDQEQDEVIGNRLAAGAAFIGGDPEGMRFQNNEERVQWLKNYFSSDGGSSSSKGPSYQPYPGYYGPGTGRIRE